MALRPDQQAIAWVLEYSRSAYHAFPEKVGPVLALMQLYWEATITQSRRIRGMAANQILVGAIEGRVGFGPDDFAFIRRDAGRMAQFLIDAEPALRLAVTARNHSAATSIERSLGRKPWWHADATLDPAPVTMGGRDAASAPDLVHRRHRGAAQDRAGRGAGARRRLQAGELGPRDAGDQHPWVEYR